jgi:hypothetical protein
MADAMLTEVPETTRAGAAEVDVGLSQSGLPRAVPPRRQVRNAALAVALLLSFASVIALLIIAQPFADAAGGCGGG